MTPHDPTDTELDEAAAAWLLELQLATTFDPDAGTMAGRAVEEYQLVVDIATTGPRTPEEARKVLDRPDLRELLRHSWADEPPTPTLVDRLAADDLGRMLLNLAPDQTVVRGPAAWFRSPSTLGLEAPSTHAASSTEQRLLDTHRDPALDVEVEAWQTRRGLEARIAAGARTAPATLALRLRGRRERTILVPLSPAATTATVALVDASGLDVGELEPVDSGWVLTSAEAASIIEESVRLSDGRTQRAWQELAGRAEAGPHVRAAVAEGLR